MSVYIKAVLAAVTVGCVICGCIATDREIRQASASTTAETRRISKDLEVLLERIENIEHQVEQQQRAAADQKAYLTRLNDKIDQKNSDTFERLSKQIAEVQKSQNENAKKLRREINAKIQEINRVLTSLSGQGSTGGGGEYQTGFYHTVAEGESLWSIRKKYADYGVTIDDIRKANNIPEDSSRIIPGQKLFIPTKQ